MLRKRLDDVEDFLFAEGDFPDYRDTIVHEWLHVLTMLGIVLVPLFLVLDFFMMPRNLLPQFVVYRSISTLIVLTQYFIVKNTKSGAASYVHGYLVSINIGGIIALMTVDLGGFNSSYYAGLNLVLIGVNLLLPWKAVHSALNSFFVIGIYIGLNLLVPQPYESNLLLNNLFFLCATAVVAVSINHVKYKLIRKEFHLLVQLKKARDALWSEMELAKRIQSALLPDVGSVRGYEVAAKIIPAREVGGDYYDVIETEGGERWVTIGDVSGHGVDSGLIMMMAQTSVMLMVKRNGSTGPSMVLDAVNTAIRENISRLKSDYYMTMTIIRMNDDSMTVAGHHQDIVVYRAATKQTEVFPSSGTWLGIVDDLSGHVSDQTIELCPGDIVMLYTDGMTEAMNDAGEMYGRERLEAQLREAAGLQPDSIVDTMMRQVGAFQDEQRDDMTLLIVKRTHGTNSGETHG